MSTKAFMKRIPKTVRVGPLDYQIRLMCNNEQTSSGNIGMCEPNMQIIRIQENPPSSHSAVDTLLHEISHAIFHAYHIGGNEGEERISSVFGTAWTQVYRDNPALLVWITAGVGHA